LKGEEKIEVEVDYDKIPKTAIAGGRIYFEAHALPKL